MEASTASSDNQICQGCKHNLYSEILQLFGNSLAIREYLINHGVLPRSVKCQKCNIKCSYRHDKHQWYCNKWTKIPKTKKRKRCDYCVTEYRGTFLSGTHLPLWKIIFFINNFLKGIMDCKTMKECNQIDIHTGIKFR